MTDYTGTPVTGWVSSSYSGPEGGQCVQWAPGYADAHSLVPVRDSKNPGGPALMLTPESWTGLVEFARHSEI
ncbi:DUF397 domain-containing protein [Streptomyces sp. LP05-1]|uniref:DUF397 domain-containing protein n=1 Tax=Streptomyces pyxinae TaxID=2970734 RepID=A0ABT2CI03_9ACTN|nr:DUF397 domain-containing protein [Streptomyces sp. LP05-1]MCS0637042.1 DUF397 domain-containing protein [Streptomyces sp. LP05-1]